MIILFKMKKQLFVLLVLFSVSGWTQNLNDFKYVIVPTKFDFMRTENEYRLSSITKANLEKMGFICYYNNADIPRDVVSNACSLLNVSIEKTGGMVWTKFRVVFKDCQNKIIHISEEGKSKEKEYKLAYEQALEQAFASLYELNYSYSGNEITKKLEEKMTITPVEAEQAVAVLLPKAENALYAQQITNGFQLVDNTPKILFVLQNTNKKDTYLAQKGNQNGIVFQKDGHWFFEYYQGDKLISEKINIKF